ncbi:MAG: AAA domain-containing protein, partial [Bacteroidota bacterium]
FPLPANDEQRRIVKKVEDRRGVLVQGPPGTGKSHTISNLIAHFLARGKRILVTSETPRALEVLRHKLQHDMPEIEKLCVVWLGSGSDSQEALRKSVDGITHQKANWNATKEQSQIDHLVHRLDVERKEQARLRHDLRACRESDIYRHESVFGRYTGTLQNIAIQVNENRERYQWFADRPLGTSDPPVQPDELLKMLQIHRRLTNELVEQLQSRLFPVEKLIQPNEFRRLVDAEQKADLANRVASDKRKYPGYERLSAVAREKRDAIRGILGGILATQDTLSKHFHSWAERAAREIVGDNDRIWRHMLSETIGHVQRVENLIAEQGELDVVGLEGKDLRPVQEHISALKKHLESGRGLGLWIFSARVVKDARYVLRSTTVNGKPCKGVKELNHILAWIEITAKLGVVHDMWKATATPPTGNAECQCHAYRDLCKPIELALTLQGRIKAVLEACGEDPGILFPAWHSQDEVRAFNEALDALTIEEDLATANLRFSPLVEALQHDNASGASHASTEQLLRGVSLRDVGMYQEAFELLSSLHTWARDYNFTCDVHERFSSCAPRTCENYDNTYNEAIWNERFSGFADVWTWAKADRWLDEVSDKEQPKRIQ